jgi:hypothetical protein
MLMFKYTLVLRVWFTWVYAPERGGSWHRTKDSFTAACYAQFRLIVLVIHKQTSTIREFNTYFLSAMTRNFGDYLAF